MADFNKVKEYLFELEYEIKSEDKENEIIVISDAVNGINNLVIDCEEPIIILEQLIVNLDDNYENPQILSKLLKMNRLLVHGAFVLDETGKNVIFRDTLQIENLDLNELKGSIDSLVLAMKEFVNEFISFIK